MRGSKNFCQGGGGGGSLTARKQPGQRFFFLLVLNLFFQFTEGRGPMVLLQRKLYFSRDRGGPTFLGGGGAGSKC